MEWLKGKLTGFSPWTVLMLSSIIGSTVFLGAAMDFFWHLHGLPEEILSNPHMLLFGGALANLLWIWLLRKVRIRFSSLTMSWYGTLFFIGAFALDVGSHFVWGFEMGVESVYSLSHLGVVIAIILINYGWSRSALTWAIKTHQRGFKGFVPMVVAYTATVSMILLLMVIVLPQHTPFASNLYRPDILSELGAEMTDFGYQVPGNPAGGELVYFDTWFYFLQSAGSLGIMFFSLLLVVPIFKISKGFKLPAGSIFAIVAVSCFFLSIGNDHYEFWLAGLVAGFFFDIGMELAWEKQWSQLVLATIIPPVYFIMYFIMIEGNQGTWWGTPQILGMIGWSGLFGFLAAWAVGDLRIKETYNGIFK